MPPHYSIVNFIFIHRNSQNSRRISPSYDKIRARRYGKEYQKKENYKDEDDDDIDDSILDVDT